MADYIERQAVEKEAEYDANYNLIIPLKKVKNIPAANVRENAQGEWEIVIGSNGKEYMVCTNCRVTQNLTALFTYCPNCGARMVRGNKE